MRWSMVVLAALALAACGRTEERGAPEAAPDTGAVQEPGTAAPGEGVDQPTAFPGDPYGPGREVPGEGGSGAAPGFEGDEPGEDVKLGEPDGGIREEAPGAITPEESEQPLREGGQEPTGEGGSGG